VTRIAIAAIGDPLAASTWSGIPAELARGLAERGIDVAGLEGTPPSPLREGALAIAAAVRRSRVDAWYTRGLHALRDTVAARRLRALGPLDGVVLLGAEFGLPAGTRFVVWTDMTLAQARATHPVFRCLSDGTFRGWNARQGRILRAARNVLAASHWTARSLREDYGLPAERVHVVGFPRNHTPPPRTGGWSPPRFLFVGREWERKRGADVVAAFTAVRAAHPEARLDVVGGHPPLNAPGVTGHGPLRLTVPEEAARASALFAQATCFVMPSELEPFGIVYAEAAAAGLPSIATARGGAGTIVGEDAGVLVEPGDLEALRAAMLRLADPQIARALGERARERAERFSRAAVSGRVLRALAPPGVALDGLPEAL
jgi:glycosyltransferase involved in cell wall biosynthesis